MRPHCWPSTTSFIWPSWWDTYTQTHTHTLDFRQPDWENELCRPLYNFCVLHSPLKENWVVVVPHDQVVNLFNMFITYGDTFLPTSNSYDELYYEIVRMHQVFDNLYCMGTLQRDVTLEKIWGEMLHRNGKRWVAVHVRLGRFNGLLMIITGWRNHFLWGLARKWKSHLFIGGLWTGG